MADNTNIIQTIEHYGKQLFRFVRGRVSSKEDAEDILQEVWYQLSSLADLEAVESVSGWLYRVARNRIIDNGRKKKPDALEDYRFTNQDEEPQFREILLATAETPEDEYLRSVFWETLFNALEELPEKQREVFILNELEDKTLQEIADMSGENLKTIISRKRYAVQYLRQQLGSSYEELLFK
jgi:RNA polymerase sigma factor (sigma-70 family)